MNKKLNALFVLVLSGLLLGIAPQTRLVRANDEPDDARSRDHIASATIQFLLVHVERDMLDEHMDESDVPILDAISLEEIGRCIRAGEGAEIISQTKLTILDGHEAEMTVVENERRKEKNGDEEIGEEGQREAEVSVWIGPKRLDGDTLIAEFVYKRTVVEENHFVEQETEEEEGTEQKFEIASGIVLGTGQACIAGANMNEDVAALVIIKADLR